MKDDMFHAPDPERNWERFVTQPEDSITIDYTNEGEGMLSESGFEHLNDTLMMFVGSRMYRFAQKNNDRLTKITVQVSVRCE